MHPYVHVWDVKHPIFQEPVPVKVEEEIIDAPAPYDYREFRGRWKGGKVPALRIHRTNPPSKEFPWGYAIYDDGDLASTPDAEKICGGVTGKGPAYYSVIRHGDCLLWGFAAPPADLTEQGRRLFLNTVHYAARFKGKGPVVRKTVNSRRRVLNTVDLARINPGFWWILERDLPAEVLAGTGKDLDKVEAWYRTHEPYLCRPAEGGGRIVLDAEAHRLGTPNGEAGSLARWISLLGTPEDAAARTLLKRYAPTTCEKLEKKEDWERWLEESRDRLFFSDSGGFRFFLRDP